MLSHIALWALAISWASAIVLRPRDLDAQIQDAYDYVVVGCGIAGLVVANRLSEDPNVSVLCLEAGPADLYEEFVLVPQFVGTDVGSQYDWKLGTTDQHFLDGNPRPLPQGKAVGGGSILNALIWHRGPREDYDAWEALGNPGWNWNNLLPYFKKSEKYTPDFSAQDASDFQISYTGSAHGFDGPVNVAYPAFFYPQAANLMRGLNEAGIPTVVDPSDGSNAGAAFCPQDINPTNQTRSDARRSYLDPYITRSNFHVASNQHVTQILFDTPVVANPGSNIPTTGGNNDGTGQQSGSGQGLFGVGSQIPPPANSTHRLKERALPRHRAIGVEFAADASTPRRTVRARREVIVAAGASHSPQVLQLSGIGPAALLQQYGITVLVDLPGVGQNLQDHCLVGTFYPYNNVTISPAQLSTNATLNEQAREQYYSSKTGPWTHGAANAVAFPPLGLTTNRARQMLADVAAQTPEQYLPPNSDPTIIAGYQAQKLLLQELLANNRVPAYEIIPNDIGSLTVAVMHPFSRGTVSLRSNQPFDTPVIDPRWCANPFDKQVLLEALLFNRVLLATPSMQELQPAQFVPPVDASDNAIIDTINNGLRTEYHVSGSCIMLPLEQGGVVDSNLLVYGTTNLRVVDASMMPLVPAAHLQATVYAVAERISDIIKAANAGGVGGDPPLPSGATNATSSATTSSSTLLSTSATATTTSTSTNSTTSSDTANTSAITATTTTSNSTSSSILTTSPAPTANSTTVSSTSKNFSTTASNSTDAITSFTSFSDTKSATSSTSTSGSASISPVSSSSSSEVSSSTTDSFSATTSGSTATSETSSASSLTGTNLTSSSSSSIILSSASNASSTTVSSGFISSTITTLRSDVSSTTSSNGKGSSLTSSAASESSTSTSSSLPSSSSDTGIVSSGTPSSTSTITSTSGSSTVIISSSTSSSSVLTTTGTPIVSSTSNASSASSSSSSSSVSSVGTSTTSTLPLPSKTSSIETSSSATPSASSSTSSSTAPAISQSTSASSTASSASTSSATVTLQSTSQSTSVSSSVSSTSVSLTSTSSPSVAPTTSQTVPTISLSSSTPSTSATATSSTAQPSSTKTLSSASLSSSSAVTTSTPLSTVANPTGAGNRITLTVGSPSKSAVVVMPGGPSSPTKGALQILQSFFQWLLGALKII